MKKFGLAVFVLLMAGLTVAACAPAASGPSVKFSSPTEGATVSGLFAVKFSVTGLTLIPAATPSAAGQGHLHIIVDDNAPPAGQAVPRDDNHIHLGTGASEYTFAKALTPGKHKLVVVFADSGHNVTNPPITDSINITVQ